MNPPQDKIVEVIMFIITCLVTALIVFLVFNAFDNTNSFDNWCYNHLGKRDANFGANRTCGFEYPLCNEECELPSGENVFYYDEWEEKEQTKK